MFFFIWVIGIAGAAFALGVTGSRLRRARSPISSTHVRGRILRNPEEVTATLSTHSPEQSLQLGRFRFPGRIASGHFAFVGTTGSGKTMMQRLLMQSVLPQIGRGRGVRALIYDAKQDLLSILAGMKLSCPIRLLHPLDARASAWDMASDITSPASALQVASILIPRSDRDTNPFFTNAARHLLYGVLLFCVERAPRRWSLRQVLLILRDAELLKRTLENCEHTSHLTQYCAHEGTFQNILSTLLTLTSPYEIIAAAWDKAGKFVSLRRWLEDESILVLGNDEANRVAMDTMNRLIFQRLSELILGQSEVSAPDPRQTWLFLDEVREMGRLEGLSRLLTKGRSKGVAAVLGFQDVAGLHSVYGKDVAEEILGQCNSKVLLRLNSPGTAKWASQLFGTREVLERSKSQNRSRSCRNFGFDSSASSGEAVSSGITRREVVLESEFLDLPEPNPDDGLDAYFLNPITGGFRDHLSGDWIGRNLIPADPRMPDLMPRPESDQYLRPWCEEDAALFGLSETHVFLSNVKR
ncbi:MAG TPA: type IV secretion system DNA-binding domain-containing protein [Verrucomicrobiota bacterium]|nr:type IV secretion system DNA-binding domain-containing protein [Verrucomicrobiota bacterium]